MSRRPIASPAFVVIAAALTALISAGVCAAAVLVPAPAAALPLVVLISVGCPVFAAWELPRAVESLRAERSGHQALASMQATLAQLPETEHPLGL